MDSQRRLCFLAESLCISLAGVRPRQLTCFYGLETSNSGIVENQNLFDLRRIAHISMEFGLKPNTKKHAPNTDS